LPEVNPVLTRGQVRYWRYNRKKIGYQFIEPVVPVDRLKLSEPVSASLAFDEDMGKFRKFEWWTTDSTPKEETTGVTVLVNNSELEVAPGIRPQADGKGIVNGSEYEVSSTRMFDFLLGTMMATEVEVTTLYVGGGWAKHRSDSHRYTIMR